MENIPSKKALEAAAKTADLAAPHFSLFPSHGTDVLYSAARILRQMAEATR